MSKIKLVNVLMIGLFIGVGAIAVISQSNKDDNEQISVDHETIISNEEGGSDIVDMDSNVQCTKNKGELDNDKKSLSLSMIKRCSFLNSQAYILLVDTFLVDQFQVEYFGSFSVGSTTAQTFKPSKSPLTKIEIVATRPYLSPNQPLVITIKDDLNNGPNLTRFEIPSSIIPLNNAPNWVEADIPDIDVVPGKTYFLVASTKSSNNAYNIYCGNDEYDKGIVFRDVGNHEWVLYEDNDFAFKTYTYGTNYKPTAPTIEGPRNGAILTEYEYKFTSSDQNDHGLFYYISWGTNSENPEWIGPYTSGETISLSHSWSFQGTYELKAKAKDVMDAESDYSTITVTIGYNSPPNPPEINGPTQGLAGNSYAYTFTSRDPDNQELYYFIDWGDNTNSGWLGPFDSGHIINEHHSWAEFKSYTIKAQTKDSRDATSTWTFYPISMAGHPPSKPTVNGPATGEINKEYAYSCRAVDQDGDTLNYFIDWGDGTNSGWLGPYDSGDTCQSSHSWQKRGDYRMRVQAKDNRNLTSEWAELSISMPKIHTYNPITQLIPKLLELFPFLHSFF